MDKNLPTKKQTIPEILKNLKSNIPVFNMPDTAIVSTTQHHLPIADIAEDLVVFKDGGASVVMESTSLNFGLLSEKEQVAVIAAYAAMINSLSFPIQIIVRSERKDITSYMNYLAKYQEKLTAGGKSPKLLSLMNSYRQFILDTVKKKNVLGKRFFVSIPFLPLELGVTKSALSLAKRKGPLPYPKSYVIQKAKVSLYPKRDHLIRQGRRLGITFKQLSTEELVKLYYHIYNSSKPTVRRPDEGPSATKQ